jgi:hypothetical protein
MIHDGLHPVYATPEQVIGDSRELRLAVVFGKTFVVKGPL